MSKYVNVVKVKVKPSLRNKYIKLVKARPKMIEFLNTLRYILKKLSPRLEVTDPASGSIIVKK
ncbi:hypothetical protein N9J69_00270 [Pelagibacteraceae bacterium]|nr:hypothetical protein [Pelagibacteraceae bacterium]